jgi:hypothetical protein
LEWFKSFDNFWQFFSFHIIYGLVCVYTELWIWRVLYPRLF